MERDMDVNMVGSSESSSQAGTAAGGLAENSPHCPVAVGGLLPEVWAGLLRQHQHLLDLVQPWLHQRLVGIYWDQWWLVESAETSILHSLCIYGPVAEVLVQRLQHLLQEHTGPLVHSIISLIESWCSERARGLLHSHAARDKRDNSGATSVSSSSGWRCGPAGPHSGPSHLSSVPMYTEQVNPQEEPGQEVAIDPSAQGSSHSLCTPSQDRDHLSRGSRCHPKRNAQRLPDASQPRKKLHQQHKVRKRGERGEERRGEERRGEERRGEERRGEERRGEERRGEERRGEEREREEREEERRGEERRRERRGERGGEERRGEERRGEERRGEGEERRGELSDVTLASFQSSGTSPVSQVCWQMMESGFTSSSASSLITLGWMPSGPIDMNIQAVQQFSDCLLLDNRGTILFPNTTYQPRRAVVLRTSPSSH
ncbi:hypothetical protein DUI87_00530 [Hirundo rustica rustica]|uniref:Uncharacterized protein n=1 Tax=Hirundo rustica rustica TaxID=333673 RepID=A0A3M0L9P7_HIRRU|nr:hypothetical protein DUI87_00530 [Hirundo rustica rustica]